MGTIVSISSQMGEATIEKEPRIVCTKTPDHLGSGWFHPWLSNIP